MIKTGTQSKQMIFMVFFFMVLGIVFEISLTTVNLERGFIMPLSSVYFSLVGIFLHQLLVIPTVFGFIAASPRNRFLRTKASVAVAVITSLIGNTVFILLRVFVTLGFGTRKMNLSEDMLEKLYFSLIISAILCVLGFVYLGLSYVSMLSSLIFLIVGMAGTSLLFVGTVLDGIYRTLYVPVLDTLGKTGAHAVVIATYYLLIIFGGLICYIISVLNYRKGFSKQFTKGMGNL